MYDPAAPVVADYAELDLSAARRVFAFGDLHGRLDLLLDRLAEVAFDASAGDLLFSLGDFIDRGPDTFAIHDWLIANRRSIHWVRGNHEDLLHNALHEVGRTNAIDHLRNGGMWAVDAIRNGDSGRLTAFSDLLNSAPVAVRMRTPGGRDVGFVHADVPTATWNDMKDALTSADDRVREDMVWNSQWTRTRFDAVRRLQKQGALTADYDCSVAGIDHVFFGHSVTSAAFMQSNCSWLDTGAHKTDNLTLIDVDAWLSDAG